MKNKKKLLSLFIALALLFQPTFQAMATNPDNQVNDVADIEKAVEDELVIEDELVVENELIVEDELIVTSWEGDKESVKVDKDQIIQDLEDTGIAHIDGWVLYDVTENELPQEGSFQGAMRNVGQMPSSNHDLRHVASVWVQVHNNGVTRYESFINGRWVAAFCTQPGVPSVRDSNAHPGWYEGFGDLSASKQHTISLILMHGYDTTHGFNIPTGNNALRDDAYVTTQVAIWEAVLGFWDVNTPWYGNYSVPSGVQGDPWRRLISNTGQTSGASLQTAIGNPTRMDMYDQIRSDIWLLHGQTPVANRRPSFTGGDSLNPPIHTLTWDITNQRYQITLDDNNGLLGRYLNEQDGYFGQYNWYRPTENQLTIYTSNPNATQTNAPDNLLRIELENTLPITFWTHSELQDKVTGNNFNVPLTASFGVSVEAIGNLEIIKYSETGIRIPNTNFRVVSDKIDTVITTNIDGIATLHNIPIGTFEITEIYVPLPWTLSNETFTIEVTGNTNQVVTNRLTVTNELIRGSFELIKLSEGSMDAEENDDLWLLPDVEFRLYFLGDGLGDNEYGYAIGVEPYYLATLVTDAYGRITKDNLLYGNYKLVEVVTHYRHQLLSDPIFFSISERRQHHELVMYNAPTQTQILKVDDLGEALAGAHFQLLMDGTEEIIHEWISAGYAEVLYALAHGDYILREVQAPVGFLLGADIHFTVTDAEETIYIIAENILDSRVYIATQAHTGDGSDQYFTPGSVVNIFDDIEITHINIRPGSTRAFRAYLFARLPDGTIKQVWYTDYIEYSVEHILDFNINEPNITNVQVNTSVDTSEFPNGTEFFWAETAYHQVINEDGDYTWEEDYRHNFDGSNRDQTLFPREVSEESPQDLPQTGIHTSSTLWLQLGIFGLGSILALSKNKIKSRHEKS